MKFKKGDLIRIKSDVTVSQLLNGVGFTSEMWDICFDIDSRKTFKIHDIDVEEEEVIVGDWLFDIDWLEMVDKTPTPSLTKDEKTLLGWLCINWKYIVREENGLYLFVNKPTYSKTFRTWYEETLECTKTCFPYNELFNEIEKGIVYKIEDLLGDK